MEIKLGDVYWLKLTSDEEHNIPHPHVIIQQVPSTQTLIVCAVTSNAKKISIPGNVMLAAGEANLPRHSIVEVSKVLTIQETQLGGYIGTLTDERINQVQSGRRFVQTSFFNR